MAVETKKITCQASSYTALSVAGNANVSFRCPSVGRGRLVVASAQPTPDHTDFITPDEEWNSVTGLSGTEVVYFMPTGSNAAILDVLRG